jgi:hypothetical protein
MNMNKPVFELNEIELKAVGYDTFVQIKRLQKNLDLIEMELERRRNSVVATMTTDQFNNALQTDQK